MATRNAPREGTRPRPEGPWARRRPEARVDRRVDDRGNPRRGFPREETRRETRAYVIRPKRRSLFGLNRRDVTGCLRQRKRQATLDTSGGPNRPPRRDWRSQSRLLATILPGATERSDSSTSLPLLLTLANRLKNLFLWKRNGLGGLGEGTSPK